MLRVSVLANVPRVLRDLGFEPEEVLAEAGIDVPFLTDPNRLVPFRTVGRLLAHCVKRTGCQHFGLLVGEHGSAATVGAVGLMLRHSPDIGTALATMVKYLHHHDQGAVPTLGVAGRHATLGYHIYESRVPAAEQIHAGGIAVGLRMLQELCGPSWRPTEVLFPFRKPAEIGAYERVFRAPLRFGADQAALVFPAAWLRRPVTGSDPVLGREIKSILDSGGRLEMAEQVRRAVRGMLVNGNLSETMLAQALAMSRRSLVRQLEAQGTSFRAIVQEVHLEVACQLLRDTDSSLADIAASLGYAGASPFRRAFKRWTGFNPGDWRKANTP